MDFDFSYAFELPTLYWVAAVTLGGLMAEAGVRWRESWAIPTGMMYLTILGWYMMEPLVSPETFAVFTSGQIDSAFFSVFIFIVALRVLAVQATKILAPAVSGDIDLRALPSERLFWIVMWGWIILVAIGINRTVEMGGTWTSALFPIEARAQGQMWGRAAGADAGTFGFAISIASYLYILVLALFGMLLPLLKKKLAIFLCLLCIAISWPYAFLQGSRNVTLAVFIPLVMSFVFFSTARKVTKFVFVVVSLVFIEWALRQIITYRNVGFDYAGEVAESKHLGLNMASELLYANSFLNDGIISLKWGYGFFIEATNLIPRFLWPDKPMMGIDFAVARGYSGGTQDIGVVATISTGVIGQGVIEFGPYFGPMVMAFFMAIWCGFMARLRSQGTVPRLCLFMVGMGLTFNLGRNLTLLVLWPMVFAYIVVVIIEKLTKRQVNPAQGQQIGIV